MEDTILQELSLEKIMAVTITVAALWATGLSSIGGADAESRSVLAQYTDRQVNDEVPTLLAEIETILHPTQQ